MSETPHSAEPSGLGHEVRDTQLRPIVLFGVGLLVVTLVVLLLMGQLFNYFAARRPDAPPSPLAETRQQPQGPRLQVAPARELQLMRAAEDAILHSYGWVDQADGVVRIPIERAIELLAKRGLPARTKD